MSFGRAELAAVAAILRAAARQEVMPRFRRLEGQVRTKSGPLDLVTDGDEAAEAMITAGLLARFPACVVVGEEAAEGDRSRLGHIAGAALAFVVDPIDGTFNYAHGLPLFGCMAAAIIHGEIAGAVILDPVGDDCALALRGEGAWIESPDGRTSDLRVAAPKPVAAMAGSASWRFLPAETRGLVCRNFVRVSATFDYRCAAHEYRLLASGGCDFLMFNKLMPWDHAPGWLLHREAGGYSARFDGSPYTPLEASGGLICTSDRAGWEALRAALLEP